MNDLISRQAAIEAFRIRRQETIEAFRKSLCASETESGREYGISFSGVERILKSLPSAERKGKWIDMNTFTTMYMPRYKCSICDEWANKTNFCPNCGADMRGEQDG